MSQKHPTLGAIFALIAAILFGLNASTTKVIIEAGINAEQVVFIRSLFSFALALSWALISNRKELLVKPKMLPRLFVLGVIGVGMLQWTYSMSLVRLPVGIALLIEYTAVLWVPIVALVLFKEKVSKVIWLGAALVIGGLAVVAQIWDTQLDPYGMLFAFGRDVNIKWKHGVNALPKALHNGKGRISIILWGLTHLPIEETDSPPLIDNSFGHPPANRAGGGGGPCRDFANGNCRFGDRCRFSHVLSDRNYERR